MAATLDAGTLRTGMARFLESLTVHRDEVDSLNVFPVPDGDTGTNLLLTQRAVDQALAGTDGPGLTVLGDTIARAALMGARGNSGVIMSQVLRGLCRRLCREDPADARALAEALEEASAEATRAVTEPVEGTMLSVLRDAARAARAAADEGADPGGVIEAALAEARAALERTREQLPVLAEAGVVDAGGRGVVLLLDALRSAVLEVPLSEAVGPRGPVGAAASSLPTRAAERYGFEVMYLLEAEDARIPALRERLGRIGGSLVVVGGGDLFTVHVHTDDPGRAVESGRETGRPRDVRITSLDEQVEACMAGEARAVRAAEPAPTTRCAVVAVVPGDGVARLLESLGCRIVRGGPGDNPPVGALVEAMEAAPSDEVLVLPNHRNVIPAAQEAARQSTKTVRVVPTRSVPEGIAAAAACTPDAGVEENASSAEEARTRVASGEITRAVRNASTPAGEVTEGDWLGVSDGEARVIGADAADVAATLVRDLAAADHEVVTLLVGTDASEADASAVTEAIRAAAPSLEIEVHRGDQPRYPYLLGIE